MNTDLTFITNEHGRHLLDRFKVLIKDTRFFDVLVRYFYSSGFYHLYKSLESTEKIRILIGIGADRQTFNLIRQSSFPAQTVFPFSHAEVKTQFSDTVTAEMEASEDDATIEEGVGKFLEWLKDGRLQIKAYPSENIHAKLYIMTFAEGDRDMGRVITGSSNFTRAGLMDNLEFNVELKNRADYDFALTKFNELWENAVDVGEKYLDTVNTKTWLNDAITPYELYLKFLYEYFKDKINIDQEEIFRRYLPENFLDLEYQTEAVKDAKSKLGEYGGVFVSDVVGLGKTYISAMLAQQLDGRCLVIAPPVLLDRDNPGSWPNVFSDFRVHADFESLGKLDKIMERGTDRYKNIFIDEAHRFRSETNITYEQLAQICRGKRVILVTATPLNNAPRDILAQIKLFQKAKKSTIPNLPDLEQFFTGLDKKLKKLDRQRDRDEYIRVAGENAREVREKVLKYLMVRRTRSEIVAYFGDDLKRQNLRFPEVADPLAVFYELDDHEDRVFNVTMERVARQFKYARYTAMLYYRGAVSQPEELAQQNMRKFMKILLVKRLESSVFAFRNTLNRFIRSYEHFLEEYEKGFVYVSKKYIHKIFEFLEDDNDEAVQRLIDEDKAERLPAEDFRKEFRKDLEHDLKILKELQSLWATVHRDPKLLRFLDILESESILRENKLIIFTESKETAEYVAGCLQERGKDGVLLYTGSSGAATREKVIDNFDARARTPKDDYRFLVATEVLSEGVNLHRANVVVNYDIPWNPTRLMQRAGRINRVDTAFDAIYTVNFFPTKQSNDQIKLREAAESKIQAFIEMLGADARLLTEGEEIKSHDLFARLMSKRSVTGEDDAGESELKYLQIIRNIRDGDPDLFEKVKRLPKKARTARIRPPVPPAAGGNAALLTYFRKGKLQKFYLADAQAAQELDFFAAAGIFAAEKDTPRAQMGKDFYAFLEANKKAFERATTEEFVETGTKGGRDSAATILRILKSGDIRKFKGYTDEDELYIGRVIRLLEEGGLPKQTAKTLLKTLDREMKAGFNPLRILAVLKAGVAPEFFRETIAETAAQTAGPREVILSEYLHG
jgi:superfamily II DNA/RNA helicase